jgi:hypothetical protein
MFDVKTQTPVGNVWKDEATGQWYKTVRVDDQTVMSVPYDPAAEIEPEKEDGKKHGKAKL